MIVAYLLSYLFASLPLSLYSPTLLLLPSNLSVSSASLPRSLSLFLLRTDLLFCPSSRSIDPSFSSFSLSSLSSQQRSTLLLASPSLLQKVPSLAFSEGDFTLQESTARCAKILNDRVFSTPEAAACTSRDVGWAVTFTSSSSFALLYNFRCFILIFSFSRSYFFFSLVACSSLLVLRRFARLPLLSHSYAVSADSRDLIKRDTPRFPEFLVTNDLFDSSSIFRLQSSFYSCVTVIQIG